MKNKLYYNILNSLMKEIKTTISEQFNIDKMDLNKN